ncbi:MAG: hypothetical protein UW30_C0007G0006 [Candidatus Giovannonibacteria bacterium GW2011_GWA2_44_13b]|uniref:Uncharacterized protein n=2 Tax=Candidatus Giovannoniibacteriota TaxID=1752738 RepID=A0A0G1K145_9BACT|nr:MAG: hypothetical protein UW30_C0007G0006 [Candidatus Giovannonibacteria bacterium GW2011_GWA2_44_13b]OGF82606.1 MAG: hypothetical protein A2924_01020 [Candidatus Giovannonibacteria bacterium RIFCSPLOWO2_01_FULL_44_16]
MLLESSYDKAFIDEELAALHDYLFICENNLEIDLLNRVVYGSGKEICIHHSLLLNTDMDSIIEMLREYFFKPLKTILPEKFDLGVVLWTERTDPQTDLLRLDFRLIAQSKIDAFVRHLVLNPDSTVSIFGELRAKYWLIVIRHEQTNLYDKKQLT